MDFIMQSLSVELKWGMNQMPIVWMFDKRSGEDVRLVDDAQILDMLEMYKLERHMMLLVGVYDKVLCDQPTLAVENLCVVPAAANNMLEPLCVMPAEGAADATLTNQPPAKEKGQAISESEAASDADEEEDEPVIFDFGEYVGIDDEHLYMTPPPTMPPEASTEHATADTQPTQQPEQTAEGGVPPEVVVADVDPQEVTVLHDPENPNIRKNALFPDIITFRKAIRHYAIKRGCESANVKTDPTRYRARCAHVGCPWRIHASRLQDNRTIQIKVLPAEHNCATTKLKEGKMASQGWVAEKLGDWVKKNPNKGAKAAKEKLEEQYEIKLKYSKAWSGLRLAINQVHGKYEESYQLLFNWAGEVVKKSPGSLIEIEVQKSGKKRRFKRMFVALQPCVQGFLEGCRPYIGIDSTMSKKALRNSFPVILSLAG